MSRLCFLVLVVVPATLCMKEMKEYLNMWNWDSECWGESNVEKWMEMEQSLTQQCLQTPLNDGLRTAPLQAPVMGSFQVQRQYAPLRAVPMYNNYPFVNTLGNTMFSYGRKKRAADMEYIGAQELKDLWTAKVSNLTCFMKGMGVIDDQYKIQKEFLKNGVWQMKDLRAAEHLSDSVWTTKMSQSWCDCAEIAEAIPQSALDNCPIARMFGPMARTMKFLMCKKMHTEKNCAMAQAEKLQRKYHPNCLGGTGASVLGVRDKYEEALACSMTLMHGKMEADSTAKFVHSAIRGEL